jgi:hypothetical protein
MALVDYQTVLGRMLREQHGDDHLRGVNLDERESAYLENLRDAVEFRFYASVQRSWCVARATKAAHLTLSLLSPEERARLLDEWIDSGAGAQSFFFVEADLFLEFLGKRLQDRPRELTMCQFERATLRAGDGANYFVAPDPASLQKPDCRLRRGSYAGLVRFIEESIGADTHGPLAELFRAGMIVMFSPGLPQLWHEPSADEVDLWEALDHPASMRTLLSGGHSRNTIETLLIQGAIEYIDHS